MRHKNPTFCLNVSDGLHWTEAQHCHGWRIDQWRMRIRKNRRRSDATEQTTPNARKETIAEKFRREAYTSPRFKEVRNTGQRFVIVAVRR
jgi:hypothetical protein